jgi:hypothetical protein
MAPQQGTTGVVDWLLTGLVHSNILSPLISFSSLFLSPLYLLPHPLCLDQFPLFPINLFSLHSLFIFCVSSSFYLAFTPSKKQNA